MNVCAACNTGACQTADRLGRKPGCECCRKHDDPYERADTVPAMTIDSQTLRDLSKAAKNVQTWTERRNELIKAAHAAGGGVREISRATGLSVATVHNILKPRRR